MGGHELHGYSYDYVQVAPREVSTLKHEYLEVHLAGGPSHKHRAGHRAPALLEPTVALSFVRNVD